jgi:hypothetical protein
VAVRDRLSRAAKDRLVLYGQRSNARHALRPKGSCCITAAAVIGSRYDVRPDTVATGFPTRDLSKEPFSQSLTDILRLSVTAYIGIVL